jgi:hypothetical protein
MNAGERHRLAGLPGDHFDARVLIEPNHLRHRERFDGAVLHEADFDRRGGKDPDLPLERHEKRGSIRGLRGELTQPQVEVRGTSRVVQAFQSGGERIRRRVRNHEEERQRAPPSSFLEMSSVPRPRGQ